MLVHNTDGRYSFRLTVYGGVEYDSITKADATLAAFQ